MIFEAPKFLRVVKHIFRVKFDISGLAIFPFIFINDKSRKDIEVLINHEKIHFRQQIELLFVGFIFWYYIALFRKGYINISFEREAYENQNNLNYLAQRPWFAFMKYRKA